MVLDVPDWQGSVPQKFTLLTASGNITFAGTVHLVAAVAGKSIYLKEFSFTATTTIAILSSGQIKGTDGTVYFSFQITNGSAAIQDLSALYTAQNVGIDL